MRSAGIIERGDPYTPYFEDVLLTGREWLFTSEQIISKEYGSYKIIRFLEKNKNLEKRDVFRVSDGPDLYLGSCGEPDLDIDIFAWEITEIVYVECTSRAHLNTLFNRCQGDGEKDIDFLTAIFIEVSEKELEQHFNSLQLI